MAEILLINRDDVMRFTSISGNIDIDKILPHIKTAQDIHLQPLIGTKLMEKVKTLIEDGELGNVGNEAYATLVNTYIAPVLSYYTMWDFLPFLQYELKNGGISQHQSENSATPSDENINVLIQKFKDKGDFYAVRTSDYLCANRDSFPELSESTNGSEMNKDGNQLFHGWVM